MGEYSADRELDCYLVGWFNGDLANDLPTEILPSVHDVPAQLAKPTPELLNRVLDGLRKRL